MVSEVESEVDSLFTRDSEDNMHICLQGCLGELRSYIEEVLSCM